MKVISVAVRHYSSSSSSSQ